MTDNDSRYLLDEALAMIKDAIKEASAAGEISARIMSLATSSVQGRPSIRSVDCSDINGQGLLFFIDTQTGKGKQIAENAEVALCFFWPTIKVQVIVEGKALKESSDISDDIWSQRSRDKQLAAWVSAGSSTSGEEIASTMSGVKNEYSDKRIPMPDHWAGFRVVPTRIELWRAGWKSPREKISYSCTDGKWSKSSFHS